MASGEDASQISTRQIAAKAGVNLGKPLINYYYQSKENLLSEVVGNRYSYMDDEASELALAVRATNIFFSLSLVLIGLMNIIIISSRHSSKHTIVTILSVNIILWLTRVIMQIISPQGKISYYIQYGMMSAFILVLIFYVAAFVLYAKEYIV